MLIKIHPETPGTRHIEQVVDCLSKGGIVIFPTDTLYAIGCDLQHPKTAQRLADIKGTKLEKANFSIICNDLGHVSNFTLPINNSVFKIMKSCLPGPYTFILEANNNVPKIFQSKKRTVGIRVPDNAIVKAIIERLESPLLTTSIRIDEATDDYLINPELIEEIYRSKVDIVIDGGIGNTNPSTVLDCTKNAIEIIRYGKGKVDFL